MKEVFNISDLDQVRLLSDPLKLRLLQAFAAGEKTTKQVAAELGESVTKLYRHVDALHDAGLLEVIRETPKRGTVERTFRAVARRFEADRALFAGGTDADGIAAFQELMRAGETEVLEALETVENIEDIILVRLRCKASPERIAELRNSLNEWIASLEEESCDDIEDGEEVGGLIAFYPIGK